MRRIFIVLILVIVSSAAYASAPDSRYFYSGDGIINISSTRGGVSFSGIYRKSDGSYDTAAMKKINAAFGARYGNPASEISPRFIEFLDFVQDKLNPNGRITIYSGFRNPEYNTDLRKNGKLAAKASMHQYGMAADMTLSGVSSKQVWEFVKDLNFGGTGFYHGKLVHLDVGPPRFWDEATSGVDTDLSDNNKLIGLVTDKDIYLPGEPIELRFIRMTAFPIGVESTFTLERMDSHGRWKQETDFTPEFATASAGECSQFEEINQMSDIRWQIPINIEPGRFRVHAEFCNRNWEDMPKDIATLEFEVRKP